MKIIYHCSSFITVRSIISCDVILTLEIRDLIAYYVTDTIEQSYVMYLWNCDDISAKHESSADHD